MIAGGAQSLVKDAVVDQGLRRYMLRVYNTMMAGVALSGAVSWVIASLSYQDGELTAFGELLFAGPLFVVALLSPLAIVFGMAFAAHKLSAGTLNLLFYVYAALMGVSLTPLLSVYTGTSVANVFLISACAFGALSLWGYTTNRDLSGFGSFLIMGLFGLIVGGLVNIFAQNDALDFAMSAGGVLVFAGLTAYDTQKIKNLYDEARGEEDTSRIVVLGALNLYLDLVNLFLHLLRLFGNKD